jgi:hypothetical protein
VFIVEQPPAIIQPAPHPMHQMAVAKEIMRKRKHALHALKHECPCITVVPAPLVEPSSPIKVPNFDWLSKIIGALLIGGALGIISISCRRLWAAWSLRKGK